ncbi:MAG: flagellin FliC [Bdellovibrionaceae bacterium]|nr:flagellin FliC [Pseudobdellovibrionaceae bacterium]
MSFRISSNVAALVAQRNLGNAQRITDKALKALGSGSRVSDPADDAAGFAISQSLKSQLSGIKQAKFNAEGAVSFIQTAEGSLNEQNNILIRLRELSVQSASDTIGDNEREYLEKEFTQLNAEFDRIAQSARYGGKKMLVGTNEEFEFHVGAFKGPENIIKFQLEANTTSQEVGIADLSVLDQSSAKDSLDSIDEALLGVMDARSSFGAIQSRFQYAIDNLSSQYENIESARSIIADVDFADEITKLTKGQILQDVGVSVLAQANSGARNALMLLS